MCEIYIFIFKFVSKYNVVFEMSDDSNYFQVVQACHGYLFTFQIEKAKIITEYKLLRRQTD